MKQFFLRTCLSVFALFTVSSTFAYDFNVGGFCYDINRDRESVTLKALIGKLSGHSSIPSYVTNEYTGKSYSVTSIYSYVFSGCSGLISIKIPSTVTSIGGSAFRGCSGLTSIEIPSSVTSIGEWAFANCSSLTSIEIPSSVTEIGNYAFYGCSFSWMLFNSVKGVSYSTLSGMKCNTIYVLTKDDKQKLANYKSGSVLYIEEIPILTAQKFICGLDIDLSLPSEEELNILFGTAERPSTSGFALYRGEEKLKDLTLDEANSCFIDSLDPATTYTLAYIWKWNRKETKMEEEFTTAEPYIDDDYSCTQTKVTIKRLDPPCDQTAVVKETGFTFQGQKYVWKGKNITLSGLNPNTKYPIELYVEYENGKRWTQNTPFWTDEMNPTITNKSVTPTTFDCKGSFSYDGDTPPEGTFTIDTEIGDVDANSSSFHISGLIPGRTYKVTYQIGNEETTYTFSTPKVEWETMTPVVYKQGEAFVSVKTNLSDEVTSVGFEWRKTDAPDVVASRSGLGIIYGGQLEGVIKGLNLDGYYIVRPYYLTNGGAYHYGEWTGFDPDDMSYIEPTVHTYAGVSVLNNLAKLSGVVLNGTDDILEQGFEYWLIGDNGVKGLRGAPATGIQKVLATGERMSVELTGLDAGTTYGYRAFATTASGTTYGDERTFTTTGEPANAIEDVLVGGSQQGGESTEVARYNLNGVRIATPQRGVNILRMSDGTTRKVLVK